MIVKVTAANWPTYQAKLNLDAASTGAVCMCIVWWCVLCAVCCVVCCEGWLTKMQWSPNLSLYLSLFLSHQMLKMMGVSSFDAAIQQGILFINDYSLLDNDYIKALASSFNRCVCASVYIYILFFIILYFKYMHVCMCVWGMVCMCCDKCSSYVGNYVMMSIISCWLTCS